MHLGRLLGGHCAISFAALGLSLDGCDSLINKQIKSPTKVLATEGGVVEGGGFFCWFLGVLSSNADNPTGLTTRGPFIGFWDYGPVQC